MNKNVHRALTGLLGSLTAISALLAATDPAGLGVSMRAWAVIALGLSVATVIVTAIRQAWEKDE